MACSLVDMPPTVDAFKKELGVRCCITNGRRVSIAECSAALSGLDTFLTSTHGP